MKSINISITEEKYTMENMETIKCYSDGTRKKCEADTIRIILHVGTIFIVIYNLPFVWFIAVYLQLYRRVVVEKN